MRERRRDRKRERQERRTSQERADRQVGGSLRRESIYPEKGHADEIT